MLKKEREDNVKGEEGKRRRAKWREGKGRWK